MTAGATESISSAAPMDPTQLGKTGLVGWRAKVADRVAGPMSSRTPLSDDEARALVGAVFFALSTYYVVGTVRRAVGQARS